MRGKTIWGRLCAAVAAFGVLALSFAGGLPQAVAVTTTCTVYEGDNIGDQNYTRWSSTVKSYLTPCGDGLMRVQHTQKDGVVAEYYDMAYNLTSTRSIPQELPLFGAFYATDDHYYLLTGQSNPQESAEVECYRLTKYDKEWNRLGSVGLYDCNTYIPFDAGSARMVQAGKYLIVRTSHTMYDHGDGLHHQANVTIQFDTETMTVTDQFSSVWNVSGGYVSHSFNQFIALEDNKIVAVDHGDAHPRSIALLKYNTDVFNGGFGRSCDYLSLLDIPGVTGNNDTGVSVGGFAVSDTAYLVAGNRIDLSAAAPNYSEPRGIFVSAADKATGKVTVKTIADAGDNGASTPHMVTIGANAYLLLWQQGDEVCYTAIDGNGDRTTDIYRMSGQLSDCVPTVAGGKIIWYTWDNAVNTFYDISLSDLSAIGTTRIENGHRYENLGVTDGVATLHCIVCGETNRMTVLTGFGVWWNEDNGKGYYWNDYDGPFVRGDELYFFMSEFAPANAENQEIEILISDPTVVSGPSAGSRGVFTMKGLGDATITIRPKYNPAAAQTFVIRVIHGADEPHDFSDEWKTDETGHWRICACGEVTDTAAHIFEWVTDREPTEIEAGVKHEECTACGYIRYEETSVPPLNHVHRMTYVPAKEAASGAAGNIEYWHCEGCGKYFSDADGTYEIMQNTTVRLLGDVNGDDVVNTTDARLTLQYAVGKIGADALNLGVADVSGDGTINTTDARLILQYAVGKIEEF